MQGKWKDFHSAVHSAVQLPGDETQTDRRGIGWIHQESRLMFQCIFWGLDISGEIPGEIVGSSLGSVSVQIFKGDAGDGSIAFDPRIHPQR